MDTANRAEILKNLIPFRNDVIINPLTHRRIKVGGVAWANLAKKGLVSPYYRNIGTPDRTINVQHRTPKDDRGEDGKFKSNSQGSGKYRIKQDEQLSEVETALLKQKQLLKERKEVRKQLLKERRKAQSPEPPTETETEPPTETETGPPTETETEPPTETEAEPPTETETEAPTETETEADPESESECDFDFDYEPEAWEDV